MSDAISLKVAVRDTLGKSVKKIRTQGLVPAVVHNHGNQSTHIQVEYSLLNKVVLAAGRHHPIELTVGDKTGTVLIKTVDRDPRLHTITHVVFNSVRANQMVEASVPVHPQFAEGFENHPAERTGLIVLSQLDEVEIKALPKNIPDELFYDAEKLVKVGDQVTVADLIVPQGVEVETEVEHTVATVFEPSALAAANEATAGDAEAAAPAAEEPAEGEAPAAEPAKE